MQLTLVKVIIDMILTMAFLSMIFFGYDLLHQSQWRNGGREYVSPVEASPLVPPSPIEPLQGTVEMSGWAVSDP